MKIPVLISVLLGLIVIACTILLTFDKQIPTEFLVLFTGFSSYLLGLVTHNPTNPKELYNGDEKTNSD